MSKSIIPESESSLAFVIQQHHKGTLVRKPMKLHVSEKFHVRISHYARTLGVTNSDFVEYCVDCFMAEFIRLKGEADKKRDTKIEAVSEVSLPDPEKR